MQLLQCTASLPGGSGQWNSCNALPHRLGAVGSATPAMHCHTAWGQWAVELLQCTATPPGGGGQWNSCNTRAHRLGGRGVLPRRRSLPKNGTPAMHCHTAGGQWAVQLLQRTATLPGGSGKWNSCNALPHRLGAVGSGTPAMRGPTSWGDGEACPGGGHCLTKELLQCIATLPGGSGQWNSCNALPHCLGAVGSGTPAMHCLTAWGQWAVELLQCTATLPGGDGQCNSCNAPPHCLGAVGSGTPAMHCHTAWGQWAVELLQCAGPPSEGTGSPAQEAVTA